MAEKEASVEPTADTNPQNEEMDLETLNSPAPKPDGGDEADGAPDNCDPNSKRGREDDAEEENDGVSKKQKVEEKSVEEERLEKFQSSETGSGSSEPGPVQLGPKQFASSVQMFDYFYNLLHFWPVQLNFNKYEQMVLLDLLKKGHPEPDKKIGPGVKAFQIRNHPMWKSKCLFVIRDDDTVEDFSFRKCVDHILPLPEEMRIKSDANKALGGGGGWKGRGGKGGGRGRGRGGKSRN